MKKITAIALLTALAPAMVLAEQHPANHPNDQRIKVVNFQDNNVVPFHGVTFTSTQVVFGHDEVVLDVEGGDTAAWIVTHRPHLANMVFIKPTALGSDSNITVVTNKHNYYFHATSNRELTHTPAQQTYTIKFNYPDEERARVQAREKARLQQAAINHPKPPVVHNSDYRFSGNKQIMPLHVFDNGKFTYFELRKNQPAPAIFAIDNKQGKESVVNTRREGNYLVVQRLAPQFTLRNGGTVASVFNSREIMNIKQNRG